MTARDALAPVFRHPGWSDELAGPRQDDAAAANRDVDDDERSYLLALMDS